MFDAKSILDALVKGASQGGRPQQQQGGGLEQILGQILAGGGAPQGQAAPQGGGLGDILGQVLGGGKQPQAAPQGGGLGDILGQVLGGGKQPQPQAAPQGGGLGDILGQVLGGAKPQQQQAAPQGGGGLGDILGQVLGGNKPQQQQAAPQSAPGGSIADILGQVLGGVKQTANQAQQGLGKAAHDLNQATGAGATADQLLQQLTGKVPADVLQQIKDLIAQNQLAAGAAAGGLGGLLVGTKTGRGIAKNAALLGGLALIGGLAYQAYNNWQAGQQPGAAAAQLKAAPKGSGFGEEAADTNASANNVLRAMIAAAAADGVLDKAEKQAILGEVKNLGYDQSVQQWLQNEIQNPAAVEELAQLASTSEGVIEIYTAARLAINPDTREEQAFLAGLAEALQIDAELASHIEAQVTSIRA